MNQSRRTAFTLVELIVVVAIVSILFIVSTPYTLSALQAASLTSAGDTLMQKLSQAQQRALTENRPVGLEFYFYDKDGIQGCHAVQLISWSPVTNVATPLEQPHYWNGGRCVLVEGTLSPIFDSQLSSLTANPATQPPFDNLEATTRRVLFYPNGSTNLRMLLRNAYLTLVLTQNYQEDLSTAPRNYYTVQLDPVTGRTRSYRP